MNTPPADCPSLAELESFLEEGEPEGPTGRHVAACEPCRSRLEEVRCNNELLDRLASSPAGDAEPPDVHDHPLRDAVPGYEILEEMHRGGQGVVYRAVQLATKRVVALKVLLSGAFATATQRRRFEREVDLAAGLQHPHVVTVFDSGRTGDDRPWFAMEHIEGERLDAWVTRRETTLRRDDILKLFAQICAAVTHAHQRGVIHRDLKPANIIVDEAGAPHVLDFGLARPVREQDDEKHAETADGSFLGTVAWCSPEQARGDTSEVDVRSDVYALGVMLYELLSGRLPYRVDGPIADVLHRIADDEPAPLRGGVTRVRVDRDLETVVLKTLAKDPRRRYQSVDELRRDVEHVRRVEPIDARRDSTWYVLSRTLRRHRLEASAAAAFLVLLAGFSVAMTVLYRREKKQADKVAKINIFLEDTLGSVPRAPDGGEVTVAALLDEGVHWIELVLRDDPEVEAAVQGIIGNGYRNLGRYEDAERLLVAALETRRREFGARHDEVARSLSALGHLRRQQGRFDEATQLFEEAVSIRRDALGERDLTTVMTRASLALAHRDAGDLAEAETILREVLEQRTARLGPEHADVAMTHFNLGVVTARLGRVDEAAVFHETALATRRTLLKPEHPDVARSLLALGRLERERGRPERACALLEECLALREASLGEDHWLTGEAREALAE